MVMCFVPDCKHYSERDVCHFFKFPKDPKKMKSWLAAIRRADREPSIYSVVCSCHFKDGKKENGPSIFSRNEKKVMDFPEIGKRSKKSFPLADKKILKERLVNIRREGFTPTVHSVLGSQHFEPSCFWSANKKLLKPSAIPTVFNFPELPKEDEEKEENDDDDLITLELDSSRFDRPSQEEPEQLLLPGAKSTADEVPVGREQKKLITTPCSNSRSTNGQRGDLSENLIPDLSQPNHFYLSDSLIKTEPQPYDCKIFGNQISTQLKKLTPQSCLLAQLEIKKILAKYRIADLQSKQSNRFSSSTETATEDEYSTQDFILSG